MRESRPPDKHIRFCQMRRLVRNKHANIPQLANSTMNPQKSHLRDSFRHARQIAEIKVAAHAILTTKEQGLSQGHETFHTDDSFVNLRCIDTYVKFSSAVCADSFIFHDKARRTGFNKVELIWSVIIHGRLSSAALSSSLAWPESIFLNIK